MDATLAPTIACQVCFEQISQRLALPRLTTGNGDVLRSEDCQHPICQECLGKFVASRVQEQYVFNIRCPYVGCANEIFEQDVTRLVQAGALEHAISDRFAELRSRDYSTRAQSLSQTLMQDLPEQNFDSVRKLWETMRLCPRCNLAIQRSQGCNSFYCICGHHFDFASAPRVIGNGIRNYDKVIDFARSESLSLTSAEKFGEAAGKAWTWKRAQAVHREVIRIAAQSRMEMYDALKLYQRARDGDVEARSQIRAIKLRDEAFAGCGDDRSRMHESSGDKLVSHVLHADEPQQGEGATEIFGQCTKANIATDMGDACIEITFEGLQSWSEESVRAKQSVDIKLPVLDILGIRCYQTDSEMINSTAM
jgi:hypothetical protein